MQEENQKRYGQAVGSLLLSLLCHVGVGALAIWLAAQDFKPSSMGTTMTHKSRPFKIQLNKPKQAEETAARENKPEQEKPEPPPFIKTSPEQEPPSQPPSDPDFIASRDTEESSEKAPTSDEDAAETAGEKDEDSNEIITFDQSEQEGDLRYDGLRPEIAPSSSETAAAITPSPTPPSDQPALPQPPVLTEDTPDQPLADQTDAPPSETVDTEDTERQESSAEKMLDEMLEGRKQELPAELPELAEVEPEPDDSEKDLAGLHRTINPYEQDAAGDLDVGAYLPPVSSDSIAFEDGYFSEFNLKLDIEADEVERPRIQPRLQPVNRSTQKALYDPAFTPSAQPGFRTNERKQRSPGRFVFGGKSSYKAKATPLGRYHEQIYRRIAYYWYQACAEHRGDIIVGTLIIRLIINANGSIHSMELMQRRGASVSQQAFTFVAIRKATLPPIPSNVREELIGDKMDLVFEFHFD